MKISLSQYSKGSKQVLILYVSTLGGVLLGVLSSIINTRFLKPDIYGDVRYVQNIINFISSLLLFGYFLSGSRLLALSKQESYSRRVRGSMVVILSIASLVLASSTAIVGAFHLSKNAELARLFFISIPVCFNPLFSNYINTTAQGDNHIGRLAVTRLCPPLIYIVSAYIIYKYTGASSSKMILLQWGVFTLISFFVIVSTKPSFINLRPIFKELAEENKQYGIHLYVGSLVMVATNYLAGITLGAFNTDNIEVGFYTLALTITSPLATLPAIIGTTYFKQFATEPRIPRKVLLFSVSITLLSCVVFILVIRPLVNFLYTTDYAQVGIYASWLAVGYCVHGLGDMINRFLGSHGRGKEIRNSSILNGIIKILGYTVLVYYFNTIGAVITTIICSFVYTLTLLFYYHKFTSIE